MRSVPLEAPLQLLQMMMDILSFIEWRSVHHPPKSNFLYMHIVELKQIEYSWLRPYADLLSSPARKVDLLQFGSEAQKIENNQQMHAHHSQYHNETHQKSKDMPHREVSSGDCLRVCMHGTNSINSMAAVIGISASRPFQPEISHAPRSCDSTTFFSPPGNFQRPHTYR